MAAHTCYLRCAKLVCWYIITLWLRRCGCYLDTQCAVKWRRKYYTLKMFKRIYLLMLKKNNHRASSYWMLVGHHRLQIKFTQLCVRIYLYHLRMWNQVGVKVIHNAPYFIRGFCRRCVKGKFASCAGQSQRQHRKTSVVSCITQTRCVSNPPWRILFFGSDDFAVESLKRLHAARWECPCL